MPDRVTVRRSNAICRAAINLPEKMPAWQMRPRVWANRVASTIGSRFAVRRRAPLGRDSPALSFARTDARMPPDGLRVVPEGASMCP